MLLSLCKHKNVLFFVLMQIEINSILSYLIMRVITEKYCSPSYSITQYNIHFDIALITPLYLYYLNIHL